MGEEVKSDPKRGIKLKGADKAACIPIKVAPSEQGLKKPEWICAKLLGKKFSEIKNILREQKMCTACEEAPCPSIGECSIKDVVTLMIMSDICTRRCPLYDAGHSHPNMLDPGEPKHSTESVKSTSLRYVIVISVDRNDLRDGGAQHFTDCIKVIRETSPNTKIEILVPNFHGRLDTTLKILVETPPDMMNHNLETHSYLYKKARSGTNYQHSLDLLRHYKGMVPHVSTKLGIMAGLGGTDEDIREIMRDMCVNNIEMITIG